ncbi:MAG: DUF349 domain-containing protein [Candidatus Delongbacteria bacterium]|jgi:hypothetical protein|nr:DUF349 domain-containing protein [Candidatus Delongbacteria bacterium]
MTEDLQNNPLSSDGQSEKNPEHAKSKKDTGNKTTAPDAKEQQNTGNSSGDNEVISDPKTNSTDKLDGSEQPASGDNTMHDDNTNADTNQDDNTENMPDFTSMSKDELLQHLKELVIEKNIPGTKARIDAIKNAFYKTRNAEIADLKRLHVESGKDPIEFEPPHDKDEVYLKELLDDYKKQKAEFNKKIEKEKNANLNLKQKIIEQIKVLANGEESLDKTFEEFKRLQREWQNVGNVPKEKARDLWASYNLQVERFYDFIKINKELRDLDFKKNMETKIKLCEKAEKLLLETDIIKAWKTLQAYHDEWRETGPVPKTHRDELWERFSKTSHEINKKHQARFLEKKEEQNKNLNAKTALCEKAEELAGMNITTIGEWNEKTEEILNIQKVWKTIGMVPKKHNQQIYERFRSSCNVFFDKKHEFFKERHDQKEENLQKKTDLCIQAEALKNNTEWNETRDTFIELQKQWKKIGPVPKKDSEAIWKRFRSACDHFFTARDEHFKNKTKNEKENAEVKRKIIEEIKNFEVFDDKNKNLEAIQNFQARWSNVGFVTIKEKDKLRKDFRKAIDDLFDKLNISKKNLDQLEFQSEVDEWAESNNVKKIEQEQKKLNQIIKKIKDEIVLLENNMSFFSGSSSDKVLKDVKKKIEKAKKNKEILLEKRKILDLTLRKLKKNE